jgi:hypothetical protein
LSELHVSRVRLTSGGGGLRPEHVNTVVWYDNTQVYDIFLTLKNLKREKEKKVDSPVVKETMIRGGDLPSEEYMYVQVTSL